MSQTISKICRVCSTDLNGQKRVKDAAGDYFCPECWKTSSEIFGDVSDVSSVVPIVQPKATPAAKNAPTEPNVKIVRKEPDPTIGQAVIQGVKQGAVTAVIRLVAQGAVFLIFILTLAVTKKLFPDLRNGPMTIVTISGVLLGAGIVTLVARALNLKNVLADEGMYTFRVKVLISIGFALAYALAIAMTVAGG